MTRRTDRINSQLREEISDLLRRSMKDPRIGGLVSITEVDVSPDLRQAKVYVSVLGTEEEKLATFEALNAAARFLQRELRRRLKMRRTPELTFMQDESLEEGARMLSLLQEPLESRTP